MLFNSNYSYLITAVLNASEKVVKGVIVNQTLPSFLGGSLEYMHTVPLISRIFLGTVTTIDTDMICFSYATAVAP